MWYLKTALVVGSAAVFCGCDRSTPAASSILPAAHIAQASTVPAAAQADAKLRAMGSAVTEQQAQQFASAFEQAITDGRADVAANMFHWDLILEQVTEGVPAPAAFRIGFINGTKQTVTQGGLTDQIAATVAAGHRYTALPPYQRDGLWHVVFRLSGDSLNYHDATLVHDGREVKIGSFYLALAGETFSATLRRMYIATAAEQNQGLLDRLTGKEKILTAHFGDISRLIRATQQGQHQQALDIYLALPAELQKDKMMMLYRVMAASNLNEAAMIEAADAFRSQFPNDPALPLVTLDSLIVRQRYDEAIEALRQLDRAVHGDPMLTVMEANVLYQAGRYEPAWQRIQAVDLEALDDANAYESAMWMAIDTRQFDAAADHLSTLGKKFGADVTAVVALDEMAPLVESAAYQKLRQEFPELPPRT